MDGEDKSALGQKAKNFMVNGKIFQFNLDKYTCYKKSNGKCPVNLSSIDLIGDNYLNTSTGDEMHCPNIANNILKKGFNDQLYEIIIIKHKCGHYSIINGQHRICLASKLNIPITVYLREDNEYECYVCDMCKADLLFKTKSMLGINKDYLEKM